MSVLARVCKPLSDVSTVLLTVVVCVTMRGLAAVYPFLMVEGVLVMAQHLLGFAFLILFAASCHSIRGVLHAIRVHSDTGSLFQPSYYAPADLQTGVHDARSPRGGVGNRRAVASAHRVSYDALHGVGMLLLAGSHFGARLQSGSGFLLPLKRECLGELSAMPGVAPEAAAEARRRTSIRYFPVDLTPAGAPCRDLCSAGCGAPFDVDSVALGSRLWPLSGHYGLMLSDGDGSDGDAPDGRFLALYAARKKQDQLSKSNRFRDGLAKAGRELSALAHPASGADTTTPSERCEKP